MPIFTLIYHRFAYYAFIPLIAYSMGLFMRYIRPLFFLISITSVQTLYAQQFLINFFNAQPKGADVLIEWEVQTDAGVAEYQVFRRFDNEPTLTHITTVKPSGSRKYVYLDDDIFKTTSRVIHYELQVVTPDKIYKSFAVISHNPTSVQRTWGSIKSLFR